MRIIWTPNPLFTRVELDEHDREKLKLRIEISELHDLLGEACFCLKDGDRFDLERARRAVLYENWTGKGNPTARRVDELFEHYVEELVGQHVGDCTCFPATCSKCLAEDMLGINTMKGLGKHSAIKINSAFGGTADGDMDEAIRRLESYEPKADFDGWEAHAPRWRAEAKAALKWLKAYRDEHFATESV